MKRTTGIDLRIAERRPFADGLEYGETGAYERLTGRAHFAVDPNAADLASIVDLDKAPLNGDGRVEFATDVCILKPLDPGRGNRRIFFDYGNRANKRALQFFNDAAAGNQPISADHGGNGFLMRRGYSIVWAAWQGDALRGDGRMLLDLPVAGEAGRPIAGPVRSEYIVNQAGVRTLPLSGRASTRSHPTVSMDPAEASLTRRRYAEDPRQPISPEAWEFARQDGGIGLDAQGAETSLVPSDSHIHLFEGFAPGWIYELVYQGREPLVLGLGHIAVRDLVSFLRYGEADAAATPNPLADGGGIERAYAWGRSQTGRCIRDFIYQGHNADAAGRRVFDGVLPHVSGGGLMWMNHRFANANTPAGQQYEDHDNIADRFPFSYAETTDHLSGRTDAILKRPETDPLVIHTQTATEYWQRHGSLVHTDTRGDDLPQPQTVRIYMWASSQHFADPRAERPVRGVCQNDSNVVQTSMLFRAALDAMDRWAGDGVQPPPSRVPTRADGSLVDYSTWRAGFPEIPGLMLPNAINALRRLDFGPRADDGILDTKPPAVADADGYVTLVPATDGDGIDLGGVNAPMVSAPLATYTGWNLRRRDAGYGAMFEFSGSTIGFPDSPEEREFIGDPRASVLQRYPDKAAYVAAIVAAAEKLVAEGLMLDEDIERAARLAADWGRPRHAVGLP